MFFVLSLESLLLLSEGGVGRVFFGGLFFLGGGLLLLGVVDGLGWGDIGGVLLE